MASSLLKHSFSQKQSDVKDDAVSGDSRQRTFSKKNSINESLNPKEEQLHSSEGKEDPGVSLRAHQRFHTNER